MLSSSSPTSSPSASRRYESLEELLKQAGYKDTRIFTPQRPPQSHSQTNRPGTKSGSVRDVLKLFSSWVKGDDEEAQPTLRHSSSAPHMRSRRLQHQHQHQQQQQHQTVPVPTWFTSLFSQMTTSQRGSRTAPSTPKGKRRARPLPLLLSNPRRPTTSHVSVTMSSVVCRPHSSSRSNKCPYDCPGKRSDSTSTSSLSVFEVSLHTVSSRSSSTQAEGSSMSGSSRTSAGSAFSGAKPPTLHSRRIRAATGVPLLVSELQYPSRSGCRVWSNRGSSDHVTGQHQPEHCIACGKSRDYVKASRCSSNCQKHPQDTLFHLPGDSRRRSTYDSNDIYRYDDDNDDDYASDNEHSQYINHSIDGDERMTVEDTEDEDDDDDDRIDLARILIPPRRQHSILSLREVLHMDAKRITETGSASRLLRANYRTMSNQNVSPNVTPRKKAFLPPRFFEFRGDPSSTITPPSSPLQQRQQARTPQPPRAYNKAENNFQKGSRNGYSQSSLPARMRNVKVFEGGSLWEEPEGEVADLAQNDYTVQTPVAPQKSHGGLGIINLNTSSRRGRGVPPLNGQGPNQVTHHGIAKRRGAITSLWKADPIR